MEVACTTQAFSLFKKRLAPRLKASAVEKFILCSNTRAAVERVTPKLCDWIDLEGCKSDALKIIGTLHREQKFYHCWLRKQSSCCLLLKHCSTLQSARKLLAGSPRFLSTDRWPSLCSSVSSGEKGDLTVAEHRFFIASSICFSLPVASNERE